MWIIAKRNRLLIFCAYAEVVMQPSQYIYQCKMCVWGGGGEGGGDLYTTFSCQEALSYTLECTGPVPPTMLYMQRIHQLFIPTYRQNSESFRR